MKRRNVVIGVVAAIIVLLVVGLVLGGIMWSRIPYGYGRGMMGGYGIPFRMHMYRGWIPALLFGGLILGGVVLLVSHLARKEETPARKDETPLEILKRRYASGEIDREEFERIKESLVS
jgi:putative membrane protein